MRHFKIAVFVAFGVLAAAAAAQAQEKKMETPKPGPEVKKLAYFVGTWQSEGELKPNPFMPAGKYTSTDRCEWFHGGFQVVCHSTGKGPSGATYGLGILAYNPAEKTYTYYGIDNTGWAEGSKGTVEGMTWVYTSESKMGDKTYHGRYGMTETSPTSYTFKYESSEDAKNWTLVMEGKATRQAKAPAAQKQ